ERFVDVTAQVGLPVDDPGTASSDALRASTGAMWVDVDGDGRLDLIVLGLGDQPNRLLLSGPGGTFIDATLDWALPSSRSAGPDASHFSLAAADYDRDGLVDLLVTDAEPYATGDAAAAAGTPGGAPCDIP